MKLLFRRPKRFMSKAMMRSMLAMRRHCIIRAFVRSIENKAAYEGTYEEMYEET